ncbi:hypothetical protein [Enterobacter sp. RHBSTW-01064]|uniref:hypothetical protein n=1 Tax=Enterobacter sp. RHBSTW-01064 TaxID=2742679 RepID=UPI0023DDA074|nr:hypothetical protein [Enterobacter sp. RHBSTW-01064]
MSGVINNLAVDQDTARTAFNFKVSAPQQWSWNRRIFYHLVMTLKRCQRQSPEVVPQRVGFRDIKVRDGLFFTSITAT